MAVCRMKDACTTGNLFKEIQFKSHVHFHTSFSDAWLEFWKWHWIKSKAWQIIRDQRQLTYFWKVHESSIGQMAKNLDLWTSWPNVYCYFLNNHKCFPFSSPWNSTLSLNYIWHTIFPFWLGLGAGFITHRSSPNNFLYYVSICLTSPPPILHKSDI